MSDHPENAGEWPPLKMALWNIVIDAEVNGPNYINAYELTDKLYAVVMRILEPEVEAEPVYSRCKCCRGRGTVRRSPYFHDTVIKCVHCNGTGLSNE